MALLWTLLIGGVIGWFAGLLIGKNMPGGIIGNILTGIIGAWLGTNLLGSWGPHFGGFSLIPSIVGSVIVILLVRLILGRGVFRK